MLPVVFLVGSVLSYCLCQTNGPAAGRCAFSDAIDGVIHFYNCLNWTDVKPDAIQPDHEWMRTSLPPIINYGQLSRPDGSFIHLSNKAGATNQYPRGFEF
eukprot:m.5066 g.5066  ORF g.5066 m.5066 type:complete len:100 (+) comp12020_c0_seq1:273-572(+)